MAGLGFGNVGFVGSLYYGAGGAVVVTPPAAVNRALQFVVGSAGYATLATPNAALSGSSWAIRCRVRPDAAVSGGYVSSRSSGNADKAAIIYNYVANTFEFFDNNNSTGATIRLPLGTATPPNSTYYEVGFTYDGATLRGFLNGVLSSSLAAVFTLNSVAAALFFGQRNNDGGEANITIDYLRETENGAATVTLELNEPSPGPYLNTGSYGGQLTLVAPNPVSVLV